LSRPARRYLLCVVSLTLEIEFLLFENDGVSDPPRRVPDLAHRLMNRPAQARAVQIAA
jgi:hypothetical protein